MIDLSTRCIATLEPRSWAGQPFAIWTEHWPIILDATTGCWIWTGTLDPLGYGRWTLCDGNQGKLAHRVVYEAVIGPIPPGLDLDHLCRVRRCVGPTHLEPVTTAENVLRGEGFSARNKRKTHCSRGHELSGDNVKMISTPKSRNTRRCMACARFYALAYYHKTGWTEIRRRRRARRGDES